MNLKPIYLGRRLKGTEMERINAQFFYRLATNLRPLERVSATQTILENFGLLWDAEQNLQGYLMNTLIPPTATELSGWEMHGFLKRLTDDFAREEPISYAEESALKAHLTKFENNLEAEYATKDLFVVSSKGIYSTTDLIERTEQCLPKEFRERIPDAIPDIKEAGRCIAFEVPTAAAFHIFRAVEAVAKRYVTVMRGTPPTEKERRGGLGRFVIILNDHGADARVTSSIAQLAKLHRNPTMHPEMFIKKTEILATFGMAQSVIQSMIADMELKQPDPSATITSVLPDPRDLAYEAEAENDEDDESARPLQLGNGDNSAS